MSKNKGNIFITVISNVISLGVALIISFFVTQYIVTTIGKEAYSFYPIANNFSTYFSAIFLITNSLYSRFIMIPYLKGDYDDSSKYCSTVFFSNIVIATTVFIVEFIFYININNFINIPNYLQSEVKKLFLFTFASSIIQGLCGYFGVGYYVKERMDLQAITSIFDNITKGIIVLYLLFNNKITISLFGASLFIATCVRSILDIFFYCRLMKDIPIKLSSFSKNSFFEITKLSIWSLISQSGLLLIGNIQLIISNKFLGVESGSELALIQPIIMTCNLITATVSRFLDPTITKYISKQSKESQTTFKHIYTIIEICIVIPIIVILSISKAFYKLWIPNEYTNTLFILTILSCIEQVIINLSLVNSSILTTFFKVKEKSIAYLISGICNLFLTFILIAFTDLGNVAILLSAIIIYIFYHLIYMPRYTRHILNGNIKITFLSMKDYSLYILMIFINIAIVSIININSYFLLLVICLLLCVCDILIIAFIKKINIKDFIIFIKKPN